MFNSFDYNILNWNINSDIKNKQKINMIKYYE